MRPIRRFALVCALWCCLAAAAFAQAPNVDAEEQRAADLFAAGKTADAIAVLEQVRAARHAANQPALEARALFRLTVGYRGAGRNDDATRAARESYRLAQGAGDHAIAAEALGQMYQLRDFPRAFPDAHQTLDEALRLAKMGNEPRTLARIYDTRARWFGETGRQDEAIVAATEGLTYAQAAADQSLIAGLYGIRSTFVSRAGRLGDALADAQLAHAAAVKVGPRAEVGALFALAQSNSHLSNTDEAIHLWTEVIDRYRAIGPPIGVAIGLESRCHVQYEAGHFAETLADAKAAIDAFVALKLRPSSASYSRAGMANIRMGRDTDARQWLAEAEARVKDGPDYEQAQTWTQLGIAYNLLGDAAHARRAYGEVLELARRRGSQEDEWRGQFGLGRAALVAHDPATAITHLQHAVDVIEKLRATVPAEEMRAAYLSRRVEAHEWLAAALMMQASSPSDEYVERAFNIAERARVRALADLLAEGRAQRRSAGQQQPAVARTRADIAATLGHGEVLVEYLVGEEHAYAWALSRDQLIGFELPAPSTLDASVRQALAYIDSNDIDGLNRIADDLTPALLGPVADVLPSLRRIIFVPDGPLQRLPFAALPVNHRYLAQHVAISTVGSGSLLALLQRPHSGNGVLALASANESGSKRPDASSRSAEAPLREVSGEIHDAIRLLAPDDSGQAIADATELGVKKAGFADYRVIHVAAHSLIDESLPRNSAILLKPEGGEDGALRAAEISQLPVNADLVVLAACRTQFGRILRGEGLLSLGRSFMEAGARSVVASLWDVGDRDTRVLMRSFYAGIAAGLPPDQAMRTAQLQMIRAGGELASPKVWAAFQVSGEARHPVWQPRPTSTSAIAATTLMIVGLALLARR